MDNVVGVRFRIAGSVTYFAPGELELKRDDKVIVQTARGLEFGTVVMAKATVDDSKIVLPLKEVLRIATEEDLERERQNLKEEKTAYEICKRKIREHELEMKLVNAEYTFDKAKLLFYFTAEGRVDFRVLVKDLASEFRTRIELRQIGVRDETKILGGMGICGRPLCCHSYLSDFAPVSIKMAKEQNLSLNPTKISGCCGRLMCCLQNEAETYEYLNKSLPKNGHMVQAIDGNIGKVQNVNVLKQTVRMLVEKDDEREMKIYPVAELVRDEEGHFIIDENLEPVVREPERIENPHEEIIFESLENKKDEKTERKKNDRREGKRRNDDKRNADKKRNDKRDKKRKDVSGGQKRDDKQGEKPQYNKNRKKNYRKRNGKRSSPEFGGEGDSHGA